jgi:hypothetical protein
VAETVEFREAVAPRVTPADVRRFEGAVRIEDRDAFVAELDALVQEKLAAVGRGEATAAGDALARKVRALRAGVRWTPSATGLQRGRRALLDAFEQPHNLPLPAFVRLAHKSRQAIYKDLAARPRRLLALNVGSRQQRLPDWQLDPLGLRLTREVLARAADVDAWTVYRALSEPLEGLGGRTPVEAVGQQGVEAVARAVLGMLGIEPEGAAR